MFHTVPQPGSKKKKLRKGGEPTKTHWKNRCGKQSCVFFFFGHGKALTVVSMLSQGNKDNGESGRSNNKPLFHVDDDGTRSVTRPE